MAKIKSMVLFSFILLCMVSAAYGLGEPTQSTSKIFLNPFYRQSMTSNTNYTYKVDVNPPDKISNVVTAIVTIDAWVIPTVNYYLWVDGKQCNNPSYTISTTYSGAGRGVLTFDCSNQIKKAGSYSITIRSDKNSGASTAWLDLTYMNMPSGNLMVHGTEYTNDQQAKVWLQLLNSTGKEVLNGICYADIYTPDNEEYLERVQMTNMNHDGIYYYDLPTPLVEGVYPVIALCYYEATEQKIFPTNYSLTRGTAIDTSMDRSYAIDSSLLRFKENSPSPRRIDLALNFTNTTATACANVAENLMTSINIFLYAKFDSVVNDDIAIHIYNFTSGKWLELPNKLLEGNQFSSVSNTILTNNITKSGLYAPGRGIILKFNDTFLTDGGDDNLDIDQVYIGCDQLANPTWQEVKGSSELHISSQQQNDFFVQTLCGVADEVYSESSGCEEFRYDPSYWNFTWGHLFENISIINNYQTDVNSQFVYETPIGQDCLALIDVVKTNGTYSESILQNISMSGGEKDNCRIGIPVLFAKEDRGFNIIITQDNFMKWEVQRHKDYVEFFKLAVSPFCDKIAIENNNPYEIPIEIAGELNISSLYSDNPIYLGCYHAMDDFYWFDYYYNLSLEVDISGEYESHLFESRFYYPDLKSHAQIVQGLTANNYDYMVESYTLCGKGSQSNACAIAYPPDSYFSSQEGYIFENITILNTFNSEITTEYVYETAVDVDCTAIIEIIEFDNAVIDVTNVTTYSLGNKGNCVLRIPINFTNNEPKKNINIYAENYIHWNMYQIADKIHQVQNRSKEFCDDVAIEAGHVYQLPINESIEAYRNNTELYFCYRVMDDLYWWDFFSHEHELTHSTSETIGSMENYYTEYKYFYPFIMENFGVIQTYLRNANQVVTLELVSNIYNNTAERVWNHSSRSLTNLSLNISSSVVINNTAIAESVWGWNGTISVNILDKIADAIWEWVARYTHGEVQ